MLPVSARGRIAWVLAILLVALHLGFWDAWDAWRPDRPGQVRLGWIPDELAWRLAWMALAFAYLLWFCGAVWRIEESEE